MVNAAAEFRPKSPLKTVVASKDMRWSRAVEAPIAHWIKNRWITKCKSSSMDKEFDPIGRRHVQKFKRQMRFGLSSDWHKASYRKLNQYVSHGSMSRAHHDQKETALLIPPFSRHLSNTILNSELYGQYENRRVGDGLLSLNEHWSTKISNRKASFDYGGTSKDLSFFNTLSVEWRPSHFHFQSLPGLSDHKVRTLPYITIKFPLSASQKLKPSWSFFPFSALWSILARFTVPSAGRTEASKGCDELLLVILYTNKLTSTHPHMHGRVLGPSGLWQFPNIRICNPLFGA